MKKSAILLDLDNTLYDYSNPHNKGINAIFIYCNKNFGLSKEETLIAYNYARKKVHIDLNETAASHNRLLYIQKMLEFLKLPTFGHVLKLYDAYWNNFLDEMKLYDGVINFLEKYNGKICIVSDLTAHIQYRKINKLNISKYIHFIVTSEEAGSEKPHSYPFLLALNKLKLNSSDVTMIGDNFKKDIIGALNMGIESYWINKDLTKENYNNNLVNEVNSFKELLKFL